MFNRIPPLRALVLVAASVVATHHAGAEPSDRVASAAIPPEVGAVSPGLERFARLLYGEVWKRPELSARDRDLVTLSVLVTRGEVAMLRDGVARALDDGVKPAEISELLVQLAFYTGFGEAFAAAGPIKAVFDERGVRAAQLPAASPVLVPVDEAADARRAAGVDANAGPVSPDLAHDTNAVLFGQLWRRPGLSPRDRSLVTVSCLIASGQVAQLGYHLGRAMDNGLTRAEVGGVLSQAAYFAGWPNVFSALPVVRAVLAGRPG